MEHLLSAYCRACLEKQTEPMKNVEDKWSDNLKFSQLINFLMGSDDLTSSKLPILLCTKCEQSLIAAYLFKKQCLKSEQTFLEQQKAAVVAISTTDVCEDDYSDADDTGEENLDAEMKTDDTHKPTCLKCKKSFKTNKEYQLHYREMHLERTMCSQCGKMVIRHNLEKHILCHRKTKRHTCNECGRSFTLSENLRKHERIHTGDHRYKCEYCDKKFLHWNSKRCHIRTQHTGEMKYECSICGKKFAHSSNMLRHVRYHTGELPHSCQHCAKKFNTTSELRHHCVTHTKERNEICETCSKAFGTRKALRNHQKTHTGVRDYVCNVCQKTFTQPHVLRAHLRKFHPDYPMPPAGAILSQKKLSKAKTLSTTETPTEM